MGRKKMIEQITNKADLRDEPIPGQPLIEVLGDRRVLIEHHRGVTEYGQQRIIVGVRYGHICIHGEGLSMACMSASQLVICGKIDMISLVRR